MSDPDIYTIGWICAVGKELVAATAFLDEKHGDPVQLPVNDNNTYTLGRIGKHNVVIAALPHWQYGLVSAATVAKDMVRSFPSVRIGLMVGVAGGAPSRKHDIRMGDIVVSSPGYGSGGVLQYDYGQTIQDASFAVTGYLNQPPQCMLTAMSVLEARYESDGHDIEAEVDRVLEKKPRLRAKYRRPEASSDRLYVSSYIHAGGDDDDCATAGCDTLDLVVRAERSAEQDSPTVHFGLIASANQLMKDATMRDRLSAGRDVLCFEMEAAGLMNHFPCLVIRGICDYLDTHKSVAWQGYAAMAAAAYAKDLLGKVAPNKVEAERKLVDVLSDLNTELATISSGVKYTQTRVKAIYTSKHLDDVVKWLAAPDPSSNLNKALKTRHAGSGQRLLEDDAYTTWKERPNSFLWLYGITGCGKTILSSTVIEDLQSSPACVRTSLYFYFDFTDAHKQSFENTVRSLISQLYCKNEDVRKHLDSVYSVCQDGRYQPGSDSLRKAFTNMIEQAGDVWIMLDALDECTPRDELLSWLRGLVKNAEIQTNVHLLVTSRQEQDIKSVIEGCCDTKQMIAVQGYLLEGDIRNYVHTRVREHEGLSRWRQRPDIQDNIEATLLEKANGMFRWVSCQLDALEKCYEPRGLQTALLDLPKILDETYARILANIPREYVRHARLILQFLTYSERPLRVDEAVDAITVDVGVDMGRGCRFDSKNRMPVPEEIMRYCSSLVVLIRREGTYREEAVVEEIQLAHFSVKDYLTSGRLEKETAQYLEETYARAVIAEVRLSYLLVPKHEGGVKWIRDAFPFSQYAAQYWVRNAAVSEHSNTEVFLLAMHLFSSFDNFERWRRLHDLDRPWDDNPDTVMPKGDTWHALYYASLGGLSRCVETMLDVGADVNAQGGDYSSALQAASWVGHEKIVQMLLDAGANVNTQGGHYGSALQAASYRGREKIVQMLLDAEANVSAQGSLFSSALQAASNRRQNAVVQMLLDAEANVNAQSGQFSNALQAALRPVCAIYADDPKATFPGRQIEVVELLLGKGADLNVADQDGMTPLNNAIFHGYIEVAKLLLKKGADLTVANKYGLTPLSYASSDGHMEIVQLLLEKGADLTIADKYGSTPLRDASSNGHIEIVQLLLEKGADLTIADKYGSTPLHHASGDGHIEIVQLLLEKGADVNAQGGYYGNALQAASSSGHEQTVQMLLDAGADVNAKGGVFGSALHAASSKGLVDIVRALLQKDADWSISDRNGFTPINNASCNGHLDVIKLLLETGADPTTPSSNGLTPLCIASSRGYVEVVEALLAKEIHGINACGIHSLTAVAWAARNGHTDIIKLLNEKGADTSIPDLHGATCIHLAAQNGHLEALQTLIGGGCAWNALDSSGSDALQISILAGYSHIETYLFSIGAAVPDDVFGFGTLFEEGQRDPSGRGCIHQA